MSVCIVVCLSVCISVHPCTSLHSRTYTFSYIYLSACFSLCNCLPASLSISSCIFRLLDPREHLHVTICHFHSQLLVSFFLSVNSDTDLVSLSFQNFAVELVLIRLNLIWIQVRVSCLCWILFSLSRYFLCSTTSTLVSYSHTRWAFS
jgi:hypothetical protein